MLQLGFLKVLKVPIWKNEAEYGLLSQSKPRMRCLEPTGFPMKR